MRGGTTMVVAVTQLTDEYQITIPEEVRRQLGLQAGDVVYFRLEGDQVVLSGSPGGWTEATRGLGAEMWTDGAAVIERERNSWE
jgi:AbrB family looped-hinge helix DNA binding protein